MATGTALTYDLTVGVMLDFEAMIHLISPTDVPLVGGVGADGLSAISSDTCFEKKVEWQDEDLLLPKSTAAATATTSETVLTVATGHRERFQTGDELLLASNERVRVTGYGTTADTLLVTRAFDSSTGATIATSDTITLIGNLLAEGTDAPNARWVDRNNRFNYTQIFGPNKVSVSGSERAVRKYGVSDEFLKQVGNRTKEAMIQLEQAVLYGQRIEDTSNKWRAFGGIDYWISTNVDSTTTSLTEAKFLDQLQNCFNEGGNPDRAVMGAKQKRNFSAFTSAGTIQVMRPDDVRGTVVDYYDSDFGRVSLILDRWCRVKEIFIFGRDQATLLTLRPFQFEMLSKTGDADHGQVVGEKSLRFRKQQHAAQFTALT